ANLIAVDDAITAFGHVVTAGVERTGPVGLDAAGCRAAVATFGIAVVTLLTRVKVAVSTACHDAARGTRHRAGVAVLSLTLMAAVVRVRVVAVVALFVVLRAHPVIATFVQA